MDNKKQLKAIIHYKNYLSHLSGHTISLNTAARIWVRKYAELWRLRHPIKG
ncbi:MAG: hypothetical protein ACOCSE_00640 [Chitinivibrionales bacterium]